jgi:hypothetical protein
MPDAASSARQIPPASVFSIISSVFSISFISTENTVGMAIDGFGYAAEELFQAVFRVEGVEGLGGDLGIYHA